MALGARIPVSSVVRAGTTLALAGLAHTVVNARLLRRPGSAPATLPPATLPSVAVPSVAVLVPARDEQSGIGACVTSVGRDVLVLDDGSTDRTAAVAAAAGARVVTGTPPPAGWLGKPWACAQLAALATHVEVLVLLDADVRLAPGAVDAAVGLLVTSGLDVLCPFPRQLTGSTAERLVQPLLQWSWLATLPLRLAERSPRPSMTAACGQFVVIRREALERAGGFAAVRGEVLDDLALVRAVKLAGGRGGVVDGTALASCRMYDGWDELRGGYAKSLWSAFGSAPQAAAVFAALGLAYVVPPVAALRGSRAGALGYAAAVASRIVAARRTGGRALPDSLAHPASVLALAGLTAFSHAEHARGRTSWKGRPVSVTRATAVPARP